MIRLQFALWRRDVAVRKARRIKEWNVKTSRDVRRLFKFEQRAARWNVIANTLIPGDFEAVEE